MLLNLIHRCNNLRSFKQIHAQLITCGLVSDDLVVSKVAEFFGKHVELVDYACDVLKQFDSSSSSYPINKLISSYAGSRTPQLAVSVWRQLIRDGFSPDMFTFPELLKSCAKFSGIREGKQIHGLVVKMGLVSDLYIQNSLLHFLSVSGECDYASRLFDHMLVRDVVSWTGLISGYVRAGLFDKALELYLMMDVEPSLVTFVSVLVACARLGNLDMGKGIHGLLSKRAFGKNLVVNNALLDMYVKCACLCEAKALFDEFLVRDIVSWTCMISGLVYCNCPKEALKLFSVMQTSGVKPDQVILTSLLSACSTLGALDYGRWVHEYVDREGIKWDVHIATAMVDMYAKCGCIEMALHIFYGMSSRNIFSWNSLLGGLAMHGHGHLALEHFEQMVCVGVRPNEVTFLAILTACCHSGLVNEGRRYFHQMHQEYNVSPRLEHYGCMVNLLCRAHLLDEAEEVINKMPMPPDVPILGDLLSASRANNVKLSQSILDHLNALETLDGGIYVLLSNIYAGNDRWDEVTRMRRLMKTNGIRKDPGSSVIKLDGKTHEFFVGSSGSLNSAQY